MCLDPLGILFMVGSVDDHQVAFATETVNDHVIHYAALVVAHGAVANLTVLHVRKVVGQQHLDVCQCIGTLEQQLSHVGYIEHSGLFSYRQMLCDNAGRILHWKKETTKGDDLSAKSYMAVIQGGFTLHSLSTLLFNILIQNQFAFTPVLSFSDERQCRKTG